MHAIKHAETKPETPPAPAPGHEPLVRPEVIARYFDVHKRTVALWAQSGKIPSVKIGGALRFNFKAVMEAAK
jgi:excisionase family DNA binding protein